MIAITFVTSVVAFAAQSTQRGEEIFRSYCARCHGDDGRGVDGYRSIRDREIWKKPLQQGVATMVYGAVGSDPVEPNGVRRTMPPIPYYDQDVAAVLMYTYKTFAGRTMTITSADVQREKQAYRTQLLKRLQQ
jgi:mono/diheme cytochrome c family protein